MNPLMAVPNDRIWKLLWASAYSKYLELAIALHDFGAVLTRESKHERVIERDGPHGREHGFKLKLHEKKPEAPLSPFFLNFRTPDNPTPGPITEEVVRLVAYCMSGVAHAEQLFYHAVVGVPRAGEPFAQMYCHYYPGELLKMEKVEGVGGRHIGRLQQDRGRLERGSRILLIDDMITSADSKIEAIESIRRDGYEVSDCVVIADREQGGREELHGHGVRLHTLFTMSELLEIYVGTGRITPKLRDEIKAYLAA